VKISIPELSLVLLVGPSGCGKSSFARKHFLPTEVVSSDFCRALVSDNENDQSATGDAFDLLHEIIRKRLNRGRLTVVDATNVQREARKSLIALAKEYHLFAEAIVFDLPERLCQDRNALRPDRQFGSHVVRNQSQQLRRSLRGLEREGIRHVFKLSSAEEVDSVTIERQPLWNNRKNEHGPFDIVGDVHGCFDELVDLLGQLGYTVNQEDDQYAASSPDGRKLVFVGDLVDRGPGTVQVLRLVSHLVQSGQAFCVPGNHDMKLVRAQPSLGTVYTRTGRRFFTDEDLEREFLMRLQVAVNQAGLWDELGTDWLCLDCELMPWSAKAQELLQKQYAPVGNAGIHALKAENDVVAQAMLRVPGLEALSANTVARLEAIEQYTRAYREYCWPVSSLGDLKLAPFHILASEGSFHTGKPHTWHMEVIGRLCAADTEVLLATPFQVVDFNDEESSVDAVAWWTEMTSRGGEGTVVKPLTFIAEGRRGITQPAIKCRGPEYLRIIYGPEYLLPANLERLRSRNVGAKRSLASQEFALGVEALERFVRREPLRLTHECVFGVLALESEPVDPRL
jgi:predicted kinase